MLFDYAGNSIDDAVHWEHLNQYIDIYIENVLRVFLFLFYCDCQKFNLISSFFIFLLMATGRGIFICSAAKFVLISSLEKDHSMIEMHHLKNVIFIQTILSFVLPRKII